MFLKGQFIFPEFISTFSNFLFFSLMLLPFRVFLCENVKCALKQVKEHLRSRSLFATPPSLQFYQASISQNNPSGQNLIHYEINRMIYAHQHPPYSSFRVSSGLWSGFFPQYCPLTVYFAPGIKQPLQPRKMTFPALPVPERFHSSYLL